MFLKKKLSVRKNPKCVQLYKIHLTQAWAMFFWGRECSCLTFPLFSFTLSPSKVIRAGFIKDTHLHQYRQAIRHG